jgi:hypothetical protein
MHESDAVQEIEVSSMPLLPLNCAISIGEPVRPVPIEYVSMTE